jgi:hypothetical protein
MGAGAALALGTPDPTDALFLTFNYFAAHEEARQWIRAEHYLRGFQTGLSANLLGQPEQWTKEEFVQPTDVFSTPRHVIVDYMLDCVGLPAESFNKGLGEGFRFGKTLSADQRQLFLNEGFRAFGKAGYRVDDESEFFSRKTVVQLGDALRPTIVKGFEAAKAEEEARRREWHRVPENRARLIRLP